MKIKRITHQELEERLKEGALYFYHRKVNGDIKRAFGTLCKERLPSKALLSIFLQLLCKLILDI